MTRSASTGCSLGQPAADLDAGGVHAAAGDGGVRAGEVDVLEDAALGLRVGEPRGAQAVRVDREQLAGLDLADEGRADDVEGRGLARDDPAALEPAEHQRVHAVRVAGGVERVLVGEDEAEGARRVGSSSIAAASMPLSAAFAASSPEIRSESVVDAAGQARVRLGPAAMVRSRSSAVLTRLPLCAKERPLPVAVVRKIGCAFSQMVGAGGRVAAVPDGDVALQRLTGSARRTPG